MGGRTEKGNERKLIAFFLIGMRRSPRRRSRKQIPLFGVPTLSHLVEVTGLEPTTSWSLTKRATKLRYTSMKVSFIISIILKLSSNFIPLTIKFSA